MFLVIYRCPGRGQAHEDTPALVTDNLVQAVDMARKHEPFAWRALEYYDPYRQRAYVLRMIPGKEDDKHPSLVYERETVKYGNKKLGFKIFWKEHWGEPMWKKAYDRQVREAAWAEKRRQREAARESRRRVGEFFGNVAKRIDEMSRGGAR